jgi:hypothetical protein
VIRANVTLDQAVSDLLCVPQGHRGTPLNVSSPRNGRE